MTRRRLPRSRRSTTSWAAAWSSRWAGGRRSSFLLVLSQGAVHGSRQVELLCTLSLLSRVHRGRLTLQISRPWPDWRRRRRKASRPFPPVLAPHAVTAWLALLLLPPAPHCCTGPGAGPQLTTAVHPVRLAAPSWPTPLDSWAAHTLAHNTQ